MRKLVILVLGFFVFCGQIQFAFSQAPEPTQTVVADHIFINGKILTVDSDFSTQQALAIGGERILRVGDNDFVNAVAGPETLITDLQGKTIVPGLIDNHNHFVRASEQWYRQVRWDDVYSRSAALAKLQERAEILPPGEWVVVLGGWIFEQFRDEQAIFSKAELDALLPNNPVYIQQGYGRAYVNTLALAAVEVDSATVIPGGTIVKNERGELSGELLGSAAFLRVADNIPATPAQTWDASLQQAIQDYLKVGVTALLDVGGNTVTPRHYEAVGRAAAEGNLDIRVFYTLNAQNEVGSSPDEIIDALNNFPPRSGDDRFAQFTYGEMTYTGIRDPGGAPWNPSQEEFDQYERILHVAAQRGWQIHEHANRDDKMQATLNIIGAVNQTTPVNDLRWTLAHAETASDDTIAKARDLGVLFAIHSSAGLGAVARAARGDDVSRIPPIQQINDAGAIWGLGSDGTVVSGHHPFQNLGWAVSGLAKNGVKLLQGTVSREDALKAHTINNAYMLFKENELGSLEPGKYADLLVLDRDYMDIPAEDIQNIRVTMTMVAGQVVYEE
jgi:predicted amidohydrolase YtcJ